MRKLTGLQKISKNAENSCEQGDARIVFPNKTKLKIFGEYFFTSL